MFTQSCFIRKSSPELREKLKDLGYHVYDLDMNKDSPAEWCTVIESDASYAGIWNKEPANKEKFLDCGENEELFLAIAALRDDNDFMQYFKAAEVDWLLLCRVKYIEDCTTFHELYRKLTPEELIEHFNHG
jgi:hypothetical protein